LQLQFINKPTDAIIVRNNISPPSEPFQKFILIEPCITRGERAARGNPNEAFV